WPTIRWATWRRSPATAVASRSRRCTSSPGEASVFWGAAMGEITPSGPLRGSPDLLAKFFTSSYFPPGYGARAPGFWVWRGDQIPRRGTPVRRRDRALPAGRAGAGQLAAHPPPFPDHGDGARRGA